MCVLDCSVRRPEVISVHLVDGTAWTNVRRRSPRPAGVAGLRGAHAVVAASFRGRPTPRAQPSRGGLICFWDDREALRDFVEWHPAAEDLNAGSTLTLAPRWAAGSWPGLSARQSSRPQVPAARSTATPGDPATPDLPTPNVAALTIGVPRLRRSIDFLRRNTEIERQLIADPNMLWGTALSTLGGTLATISVWRNLEAMNAFGRSGAHGAAVQASPLPDSPRGVSRYDAGTRFMKPAAFVRCDLIDCAGHLSAHNPQPALTASA